MLQVLDIGSARTLANSPLIVKQMWATVSSMLTWTPHRTTTTLLYLLAALAVGLGVAACGNSGKSAVPPANAATHGATTNAAPNFSTHDNDRDNDGDHNDDDEKVLYFGHAANAADRRDSVALVTRYFAVAAAENGAAGCRMLVPFVAEGLPEQDGQSPHLRGSTCAVVLSKLFKLHHSLLAKKQATLHVIAVRVEGGRALTILDFPTIPEVRQMIERRVGGTWKMLELLDGILE
jgi:hypothetical protein